MWQLIVFALCMVALAIVVTRMSKKKKETRATYVCSKCGEKNCDCHLEENGTEV